MKKYFILILFFLTQVILGDEEYSQSTKKIEETIQEESNVGSYERGKILKRLQLRNPTEDELNFGVNRVEIFEIKILTGEDKGNVYEIENYIYMDKAFNFNIRDNTRIILYKDFQGEAFKYYIVEIDKIFPSIALVLLFLGLTIVISKYKGVKALLALCITIASIYYIFIPSVIKGHSPIVLSVVLAIFSTILTFFAMAGIKKKAITASIGSIVGVLIAGILSLIFVNIMKLSGFITVEVINYSDYLKNIRVKELISAGVILGSLGAVMDVSMSISSALEELKEHNQNVEFKKLFNSGMNIGRDIIGTMVNTLIFAYIGSSLIDVLLFTFQSQELPLRYVVNLEFISVEILRAFCGSIGILVAVPITSYFGSLIYSTIDNKNPLHDSDSPNN